MTSDDPFATTPDARAQISGAADAWIRGERSVIDDPTLNQEIDELRRLAVDAPATVPPGLEVIAAALAADLLESCPPELLGQWPAARMLITLTSPRAARARAAARSAVGPR